MRSPVRDRQKVWWVTIEEIHEGIDNIIKYGKPEMRKQTVSATSGTPEEIGLFVDVEPKLDEEGNLVMGEDGYTLVTVPDYRLVKILDTQKGNVARYGISKVGGSL